MNIALRRVAGFLAGSFAALAVAGASAHAAIVSFNRDTTTTLASVPVVKGDASEPYQKVVIYSIGPLTVEAGDVVSAHWQSQLNYNGTPNVMAAGGIVVGTNAAVTGGGTGFVGWIARAAGSNISATEEGSCEVLSRNGSYRFAANASNIYINAFVYGASSDTSAPDLTIPGGGELVAVVERGVTWASTSTMLLPQDPYRGGALYYCIPIDGPNLHVQYSYGPVTVNGGTMVDVRFDIEGTTEVPTGDVQRMGRSVIQGTGAGSTTGTTLVRQMQSGITRPEHHSTVSHVGGNYYSSTVSNAFFNSVLYAYGSSAVEPLYVMGPSSSAYGHFVVETRPSTAGSFIQDTTRDTATLDATPRVLYSVGPIDIGENQVVEIRYAGCFQATAQTTVLSRIVRTTGPTLTTGTTVQATLAHRFHPNYVYDTITQSTAERPGAALTNQYYNVVAYRTSGANVTVVDAGEMEVVKR